MNLDAAAISQRVEARRRVLLDSSVARRLGGTTGPGGAYLSPGATTSLLRAGVTAFHASLRYGEGVVTAAAIVPERDGTVSIHIASSSPGKKPVLFREAAALIAAAEQISRRIVDISTPFRGFFVYHPDQCGKTSLKVLLRIYGDDEYNSLVVADGRLAHDLLAAAAGGMLKAEEEGEVLRRLSTYVAQDTHSLVTLHGALGRLLDEKDAWIPPPGV